MFQPSHPSRAASAKLVSVADYDAVVSDIYEAAIAPGHWEVALTRLLDSFAPTTWDCAMLIWERVSPASGRFVGSAGVHARARQAYAHAFAGSQPWSVRGHELPVGSVCHSDALVDREVFRESAFFTDYLADFRMEVGVLGLIDRHRLDHLALCIPGADCGSTARLEAALRLLMPHFQRATRISRRIGEAELAAHSARQVLDRAPTAVLMCDADLRITYANPVGAALLRDGYFREEAGRLALRDRRQLQVLKSVAAPDGQRRCAALSLEAPDAPSVGAMALRIEGSGQPSRNPDFGSAQVMIVAGRNFRTSVENIEHLREWFGLTPQEARLAALLSEGGSLEDFAETRGVTRNAVRFLLKGVFAKTGVHRQGELVAKLQAQPLQWRIANGAPSLPDAIDGAGAGADFQRDAASDAA
ncbi:MAG: helix-turn-helix transcriptional regulator [Caulobacterales bacterium]|nr:helix-turn-helix transcriptional regulator [Caulobacterales bacterium]